MTAAKEPAAIVLAACAAPSAAALDDDIYLPLSVSAPSGAETADVDVFLTVDFARRMIAELLQAVEDATKSCP